MIRYLVPVLSLLFLLASYSRGTSIRPPASEPTRPKIPDSFIALVYQNYSNSETPSKPLVVEALVRLVASETSQSVLMNITTNDKIDVIYLYRFDEKKIYSVAPDENGKPVCSITPTNLPFFAFFEGMVNATHTDHNEHLNIDTWTISKEPEAVVDVSSDDPNKPVYYSVSNRTLSNQYTFLAFQDIEPPKEFFTIPAVCGKRGVYQVEGTEPAGIYKHLLYQ